MLHSISKWLLYDFLGWKKDITVEFPEKCIICLAPHTSNWDFIIAVLYRSAEKLESNYLMKKEWFFWPLGPIFRATGGIPVYRGKKSSMTDNLAETAVREKIFRLTITPEGTRSANPKWKKGFYFIANKAQIPIALSAFDYERKLIQCTKLFETTDDIEADMKEIKEYYKDFKGKHPEKFVI